MQHSQVYCIGTTFQDLKQHQAIQEALTSLRQLDDVTADVFARIGKRVQEERKRLAGLNEVSVRFPFSSPIPQARKILCRHRASPTLIPFRESRTANRR